MLEIYLFVSPTGNGSLTTEKQIMDIAFTYRETIHFRYIPIVNLRTISAECLQDGLLKSDLIALNGRLELAYSTALDFKAVQLQGRKKGRLFLVQLFDEIKMRNRVYSKKLVLEVLEKIEADIDAFLEDRLSDLVKQSFWQDQQIAHEMNVTTLPSAVVFNFDNEEDGFLIEEDICENILTYYASLKNPKKTRLVKSLPHKTNNIVPFRKYKQVKYAK